MKISSLVLPVVICLIILTGLIKKIPVFDCFAQGAKKGFDTFLSLLPVLTGLMTAIYMLQSSGGLNVLCKIVSPVFSLLGIPAELVPLCLLSPISGSGSLSVYETILSQYGPDSQIGRIASVIAGSTETTFYALSVYFGSQGVRNYSAVIPCALAGDFISFAVAAFTVKMFL